MTLSPVLRTLYGAAAVAVLSLAAANAAEPHLVSASPGRNEDGAWPKQIRLTFNQPIAPSGVQASLMDPDGRRIGLAARVSGKTVVLPTSPQSPGVLGPYMLSWQARSTAGEAGKGDYSFFVE